MKRQHLLEPTQFFESSYTSASSEFNFRRACVTRFLEVCAGYCGTGRARAKARAVANLAASWKWMEEPDSVDVQASTGRRARQVGGPQSQIHEWEGSLASIVLRPRPVQTAKRSSKSPATTATCNGT